MLQTGIVRETRRFAKTRDITAEVEITRSSACGESCASCGLCPGQTTRVHAVNDAGAAVGDTVLLDMSDKKVLGAAFLVYIVPLITLIIGYFAGYALFKSEAPAVLTGFVFMAVTFAVIAVIDKKLRRGYTPRIVRVISAEERAK